MDRLDRILVNLAELDLGDGIVDKQSVTRFGGSCDVFSAWSTKHEKKVAVKQIREFMGDNEKFAKRLAKEIRIWSKLEHENVLPFLGYFTIGPNKMPSLVSEWMRRGTLADHMKTFAQCSDVTIEMLHGVSRGLIYLHSKKIVHADLKCVNILISDAEIPLLADFGLSLILSQTTSISLTQSSALQGGTTRWMAPELFNPRPEEDPPFPDEFSDIWAYGMVIYELMTWEVPFAKKRFEHLVVMSIVNGELPAEPKAVGDRTIFEKLWELCRLCWKDKLCRPTAAYIANSLLFSPSTSSSDLSGDTERESERTETGNHPEYIDNGANDPHMLKNTSKSTMNLDLTDVIYDVVQYNDALDIYVGTSPRYKSGVRLKILGRSRAEVYMDSRRVNQLSILRHTNIVKFLGVYHGEFNAQPKVMSYVVSEWKGYGHVDSYMEACPRGDKDTLQMAVGIASGLNYLLLNGIIYIPLQCRHILVSISGTPLLCDFYKSEGLFWDLDFRYMAPEFFRKEYSVIWYYYACPCPTPESNIWAMGMVLYELIARTAPFSNLEEKDEVRLSIGKGTLPSFENLVVPSVGEACREALQSICLKCWNHDPKARPTTKEVLKLLRLIYLTLV